MDGVTYYRDIPLITTEQKDIQSNTLNLLQSIAKQGNIESHASGPSVVNLSSLMVGKDLKAHGKILGDIDTLLKRANSDGGLEGLLAQQIPEGNRDQINRAKEVILATLVSLPQSERKAILNDPKRLQSMCKNAIFGSLISKNDKVCAICSSNVQKSPAYKGINQLDKSVQPLVRQSAQRLEMLMTRAPNLNEKQKEDIRTKAMDFFQKTEFNNNTLHFPIKSPTHHDSNALAHLDSKRADMRHLGYLLKSLGEDTYKQFTIPDQIFMQHGQGDVNGDLTLNQWLKRGSSADKPLNVSVSNEYLPNQSPSPGSSQNLQKPITSSSSSFNPVIPENTKPMQLNVTNSDSISPQPWIPQSKLPQTPFRQPTALFRSKQTSNTMPRAQDTHLKIDLLQANLEPSLTTPTYASTPPNPRAIQTKAPMSPGYPVQMPGSPPQSKVNTSSELKPEISLKEQLQTAKSKLTKTDAPVVKGIQKPQLSPETQAMQDQVKTFYTGSSGNVPDTIDHRRTRDALNNLLQFSEPFLSPSSDFHETINQFLYVLDNVNSRIAYCDNNGERELMLSVLKFVDTHMDPFLTNAFNQSPAEQRLSIMNGSKAARDQMTSNIERLNHGIKKDRDIEKTRDEMMSTSLECLDKVKTDPKANLDDIAGTLIKEIKKDPNFAYILASMDEPSSPDESDKLSPLQQLINGSPTFKNYINDKENEKVKANLLDGNSKLSF
ncbi:MAG: hypothetical protein LBG98_02265 [Puniceicoccales bacterium]|jgi:hypothetical protein|nr:hypothetical protein [Puniceicoccales bacterium]